MAGFFGIDLTTTEARASACVGLDKELHPLFAGLLSKDSEIIETVTRHGFGIVAIDAPLNLPSGLCCLEESCACQPESGAKGRSCERELARSGIPCFFTTKKSIIKAMVYRGIKIKAELESRKCTVLEVYPYGSKLRLFGKRIPRKTTAAGLAFLKRQISCLVPSVTPYLDSFNHDLCDAAIAAYTAFLHSQNRTRFYGETAEGRICLPALP